MIRLFTEVGAPPKSNPGTRISDSGSQGGKTNSFMDFLTATTQKTQQPSQKEDVQKQPEKKTETKDQKDKPADATADTKENVDQVEQGTNQDQDAKPGETVDEAAFQAAMLLAGSIVLPIEVQKTVTATEALPTVIADQTGMKLAAQQNQVVTEEALPAGAFVIEQPATQEVQPMQQQGEVKEVAMMPEAEEVVVKQPQLEVVQKVVMQTQPEQVIPEVKEATAEKKETAPQVMIGQGQAPVTSSEQLDPSMIKVNDSSSLLQRQVAQQVTDQITANFKSDQQQFTLSLHPERLGHVAVKMLFENGRVMVQIETQTPLAQHLLTAGAAEIKAMLESTGVQVEDVLIDQYFDQRHQDTKQNAQDQNGRHGKTTMISSEVEDEAMEVASILSSAADGMDYTI